MNQDHNKCTVGLLAIASKAAYRVKKDNLIDTEYSPDYYQTLMEIANQGYAITKSISPKGSGGTGESPLAAVCLEPQDKNSPIIISFRGTKTMGDVLSDLKLGVHGVVEQKFRDDAFKFYQQVREQHPDREIILTGHSLGGSLAQYVAIKAYHTQVEKGSNPLLQVRTFNTAPLKTTHDVVFQANPGLESQFVNYRLEHDVVSDLPMQNYYGNTFVFPCGKGGLASHPMDAVTKELPEEIQKQAVGNHSALNKNHNKLVEMTRGVLASYQCHVNGQFFSRYRAGSKNFAEMQKALPDVIKSIENGNYEAAISKLKDLSGQLDGTLSKDMIKTLIISSENVQNSPVKKHANQSEINKYDSPSDSDTLRHDY